MALAEGFKGKFRKNGKDAEVSDRERKPYFSRQVKSPDEVVLAMPGSARNLH